MKLEHVSHYVSDSLVLTPYVPGKVQLLPSNIQKTVPVGDETSTGELRISKGAVAEGFFARMSMAYDLDNDGEKRKLYTFQGNVIELSMGKAKFYRNDGKEIRVSISDNYKATVTKLPAKDKE